MARRALTLALLLVLALPAFGDATGNLLTLARIWAMAKYLDPSVMSADVDWDRALVKVLPAAREAKNDDELAAAIDAMLHTLHDPATTLVPVTKVAPLANAADTPLFHVVDGILVLDLGPYAARRGSDVLWANLSSALPEIAKASGVVVDLRGSLENADDVAYAVTELRGLSRVTVTAPSLRTPLHSGYAAQDGSPGGGYYSGALVVPGVTLRAPANGKAPARVIFVTTATTRVPPLAIAMRDAGVAAIVSDAAIDEGNFAPTRIEPLDATHAVRLRTGHLLASDVRADVVNPDPLAIAIAMASEKQPMPKRVPAPSPPLAELRPVHENPYSDTPYPDVEHRILAAFRVWSVMKFFYPYRDLIDDLDDVLRGALPHVIDAKSPEEYAAAVEEMLTHVADGHTSVIGGATSKLIGGPARLPFGLQLVEGEPAITQLYRELPSDADVHIGDVVVSIDGEAMTARMARLRPYVTASLETARNDRVANTALYGANGSTAVLELRDANGTRKVSVARVPFYNVNRLSSEPPYRVLPGNIGYADLTRLTVPQVVSMFAALGGTKAIIFDMRGYPNGTAWPIAPRINTKKAKVGAVFRRPMFTGSNWNPDMPAGYYFEQPIPKNTSGKPLYTGKIVMLIDDRAISQSEHTALFFEQASDITFIGTTTAGANGDVTSYNLPGGIFVRFTGHDVRHADGRRLQRVGIQPDITIVPTLAGLRAGKDEVLDRAIRFVNDAAH